MPDYTFACSECGNFVITMSMRDAKSVHECPKCGGLSVRNWKEDIDKIGEIWYTDGAHKTDYGKHGHKRDIIMNKYEKITGEKAPPPATDIDTQGSREHMHEPRKDRTLK